MAPKIVAIGASSGALKALNAILPQIPKAFAHTVIAVVHRKPDSDDYLERSLDANCNVRVKQADEKERIAPGTVYIAPPDYHLLMEDDGSFSLSADRPVNYSRPSIDVLFESAADVCGADLVGIVLTGANADGSKGLASIKEKGGLTIVQDPLSADMPAMPKAAIEAAGPDYILSLEQIGQYLKKMPFAAGDKTP